MLRAPYPFLHLETHEEDRAIELLRQLAKADGRDVREWSVITGFDGGESGGELIGALGVVESSQQPYIFIFKDALPQLGDARARRRLKELEAACGAMGKTIVFVGPERVETNDLDTTLTRLEMPLPDRSDVGRECSNVFSADNYPHIDREALVSGAMGLTVKEAHRAFHRVRAQYDEAMKRNAPFDVPAAILAEKKHLVGRSHVLEFHELDEGLDDVGGLDELKRWLQERQAAFSEEARDYGLPTPKGVLLVGVQGCGKSLTAKVIGRTWGLPLLRLDLGAVFEGRNAPEEALRHALKTCDAIAPCVLWIDEVEKGFGDLGEGGASRVLGSMLTWQQEKSSPVFLVATANDVARLPPELLRKGRFDEIFFVDLPDAHERKDILDIHLTRRAQAIDESAVVELAKQSEHFSGAELEQVVISGMYSAFADRRALEVDDLKWAIRETVPLYRTYEEQIKALRQWAENRARRASRQRRVLDLFE